MRPIRTIALLSACLAATAAGFFTDLTSSGLISNPSMRSYGISITDTDGDHRFEAFVTGFGFANLVYKWEGDGGDTLYSGGSGGLRDIAARLGMQAPSRNAIGVASCDMDGDGVEEIYVLNTDAYSGTKRFGDHIFHRRNTTDNYVDIFARDVNKGVRNAFAGRSVACVDRTGAGTYGVAAASYGAQLHLYELNPPVANNDRVVDRGGPGRAGVGFQGITGGRGITAGPIGKRYEDTPGMDIFMDNERGCNFFFRAAGDGTYTEVAAQLGITDCYQHGRGVTLMDADGSGGSSIDIVYGAWNGRHRLYSNDGKSGGRFRERADELAPGMSSPSLIRTVIAADFDNDGFQELFFNNIPSYGAPQPNRLFKTTDGKTWRQVDIGDALEPMGFGTGAAAADFDGDGLLELLVAHGESATQPLSLFGLAAHADAVRNSYLRVLPLTSHGAPARGALVEVTHRRGGRTQVRVVDAGSGYLCQQEPVAHFGLGREREAVASVVVTWPDGFTKEIKGTAVNQLLVVDRSLPHEAAPDRHPEVQLNTSTATAAVGHGAATHESGTKTHAEIVAAHEDVGTQSFHGPTVRSPTPVPGPRSRGPPLLALALAGAAAVALALIVVVRRRTAATQSLQHAVEPGAAAGDLQVVAVEHSGAV